MLKIKAHYTIPSLRHIFIVIPSRPIENNKPCWVLHSKTRKLYFERALLSKDIMYSEQNASFTMKVIEEGDFLESLAEIGSMSFPQKISSDKSDNLDFLSMNLVKQSQSSEDPFFISHKMLSRLPDEDVIEVFI